ncbi:MAG: hypothetical protein ACRDI1_11025, partial [Actinomycetota bacterium]
LTPGKTAFSHAFCEKSGDQYKFVGGEEGSEVISEPTSAGGTRLSATFDNRSIPPLLQDAGRTLYNLSAFTCEQIADDPTADDRHGIYCGQYGVLDSASSWLSYRI